jgi:hypothetical protein
MEFISALNPKQQGVDAFVQRCKHSTRPKGATLVTATKQKEGYFGYQDRGILLLRGDDGAFVEKKVRHIEDGRPLPCNCAMIAGGAGQMMVKKKCGHLGSGISHGNNNTQEVLFTRAGGRTKKVAAPGGRTKGSKDKQQHPSMLCARIVNRLHTQSEIKEGVASFY